MLAAALAGILLVVVVVMALVIWSIRRHRDPDLHIECDSPIDELMPTLAGLDAGHGGGRQHGRRCSRTAPSSMC